MKYIRVSVVLDPSMLDIPTNMMMIMKGIASEDASLMVFAYALMMEINTTKMRTVEMITLNSKTYVPTSYMAMVKSSPMIFGKDSMSPIKLDAALAKAVMDSAMILPKAFSLRFVGVVNRVAMVPRSFSPAIDSLAMLKEAVNRKVMSKNGTNIVTD